MYAKSFGVKMPKLLIIVFPENNRRIAPVAIWDFFVAKMVNSKVKKDFGIVRKENAENA